MAAEGVRPILGTMTFGVTGQVKPDAAGIILRSFVGSGTAKGPSRQRAMVDTARVYQIAAGPEGDTEATLGEMFMSFPSLAKQASVATKANPQVPPHFSLSRQSVIDQCDTSLERLGLDRIDLFYLHMPDVNTSIDDTLDGIEQLHKDGKIVEFGLSNYPAWAVVDIWHRCKSKGLVLPTVYQGMYNVITRDFEREIVPVARQFGLRLFMYNPLAGGLLSGRYSSMEDVDSANAGRFSAEFDKAFGDKAKAGTHLYRARYSKAAIFEGLKVLREACAPVYEEAAEGAKSEETVERHVGEIENGVRVTVEVRQAPEKPKAIREGVDMASVALRWLIHHSLLSSGDGIILGVSNNSHLVANLAAWQAGPLPDHLREACEAAWELARPACESYFRGYGAQPGGIERFLTLKAAEEEPDAKRPKA